MPTPPNNFTTAKTSRQIPVALPAATFINGQAQSSEIQLTQPGTNFYVVACSSPVLIQPQRAGAIGGTNLFGNGQGQTVADGFETLKIANTQPFPVVALVWVGFDEFINNQLVLAGTTAQQIAFPTYQTPGSASHVAINDLSGQVFTDINGKKWGAINRVAILVFNTDSGTTLLLQKAGASTASGVAVGVIYPVTPIRFDFGGNYSLDIGGGSINAVVSEIYLSIPL
jgi:hypothetical protein